ncbi:MAG: type II toxin-antitoxin system RelE/ParE family toxin [Proteobacteria bacterium]|nr:type II toxin-antitoxin system RelE/ParE family toxin [Pseudomonadota bacterium]
MAVYKTRWFDRWARREGLDTPSLCAAVHEMTRGLIDADLGGGLVKKRIGRPGRGKSGGYRTLVATNKGSRWVFMFGFPKNERSNIDKDETEALKKLAAHLLSLTPQAVRNAQRADELIEVDCDAKDQVADPCRRA